MSLQTKAITKAYPLDSSADPIGFESNGAPRYDRQYSAHDLRETYRHYFSDGVMTDWLDELAVTEHGGGWYVGTGCAVACGLRIDNEEAFKVLDQRDIPSGQYAYITCAARFDSEHNDGAIAARLSAKPDELPVRDDSTWELFLARIDWQGRITDMRLDGSKCGPVTFRFDVDTDSFTTALSQKLALFDLEVGEVESLPPLAPPTVRVTKPVTSGEPCRVDFGIPRGARGERGDDAPGLFVQPSGSEPPHADGAVWLVSDEASNTVTGVRAYRKSMTYPGAETSPGRSTFPGGVGEWVEYKIGATALAR